MSVIRSFVEKSSDSEIATREDGEVDMEVLDDHSADVVMLEANEEGPDVADDSRPRPRTAEVPPLPLDATSATKAAPASRSLSINVAEDRPVIEDAVHAGDTRGEPSSWKAESPFSGQTQDGLTPVPGGDHPVMAMTASAQEALASVDVQGEASFVSDEPTVIPGDESTGASVDVELATDVSALVVAPPVTANEAPAEDASALARTMETEVVAAAPDDSAAAIVKALIAAGVAEPTQEAASEDAVPPSDDELLNKVVLPRKDEQIAPGRSAMLDDDRTVITGIPLLGVSDAAAPSAVPSWPADTTAPVQMRPTPTLSERMARTANRRVQTSVSQLAILVVAAGALGGAAVKATSRSSSKQATKAVIAQAGLPAIHQPAVAHLPEIAPLPPAVIAHAVDPKPTPAAAVEVAAEAPAVEHATPPVAAEKPAPRPRRPAPAQVDEDPFVTSVAMAKAPLPVKTTVPKKAPATGLATTPTAESKPRSARQVAQRSTWVDPFAQ